MTVTDTLTEAIAAARAGRNAEARSALLRVLEADERNELAWLWLSGVTETPEERRICLENVLTINPTNAHALHGLKLLNQQHPPAPAPAAQRVAEDVRPPPPAPAGPPATSATVKLAEPQAPALPPAQTALPPARNAQWEGEEPCPYCGAPTQVRHRSCPDCHKSLMVRTAAREQRSWALTIIASLYALGSVGTLIGGGGAIVSLIGAATVASSMGRKLPPQVMIAVVVGVLVMIALLISMTVGLFRRSRWAYIAHIVNMVFTALLTVVQVVFAGAVASMLVAISSQLKSSSDQADAMRVAGFIGGGVICSIGMLAVWVLLTVLSHRDFYGPMARITTAGVDIDSEPYDAGIRFRDAGMWYMAAYAWERAARAAPNDVEARHALGLAYARLRWFEQAAATLRAAIQLQPGNPQLAADLKLVERLATRK